jgi:hypothetical protein
MATQPRNLTQLNDGYKWIFNNVQNIISPSGNAIVISANNSPSAINAALNIDVSGNLNVSSLFKLPVSSATTGAATGSIRFNSTTSSIEVFNGTSWVNATPKVTSLSISAGLTSYYTITYADSNNNSIGSAQSGGYTIYTFKWNSATTPGTTISGTITPNFTSSITYLVVAGGGAGGGRAGGGGGAGGLLTGSTSVNKTAYTLQVGQGGLAGTSGNGGVGPNGTSSQFNTIVAAGGGGGGSFDAPYNGQAGGSGGGGNDGENVPSPAAGSGNTPATSPSQGNTGGTGAIGGGYTGGGGGGAGGVGGNSTTTQGGAGGVGSAPANITAGALVYYAGGGGGGIAYNTQGPAGTGGNGGGGNGGPSSVGLPGTNGLGGGGGGGGYSGGTAPSPSNFGGNGGSGVVILRFLSYV